VKIFIFLLIFTDIIFCILVIINIFFREISCKFSEMKAIFLTIVDENIKKCKKLPALEVSEAFCIT